MNYYLRCTLCGADYDPKTTRYVCPHHGKDGILDVVIDYKSVAAKTSPQKISDSRDYSIWRYADLLPLENPRESAPPLQVGWTPLYHAKDLGAQIGLQNLFIKDDGRNPTASFKDRASAVVVAKARELGVETITTASSGNAGAALAGLAAAAKMRAVIFVPHTAPQAKIAQLLMYGAQVFLVRGTYDDAFDLCLAASKEFGWYCRNTAYNPYTVEGKKTAAFEIAEQLVRVGARHSPDQDSISFNSALNESILQNTQARANASPLQWIAPDTIFVSVGDGNIISGIWKGLRDLLALGWIQQMPRLIGVQAEGSAACYNAWRAGTEKITAVDARTIADSISVGIPRDGVRAVRAVRETRGAFITVTDDEILTAMRDLARGAAVFAEPAGAAAYAGLAKAIRENLVHPDETVVCIVTGNGLKDVASALRAAGEARVIEPTLEALKNLAKGWGPSQG